jgi:hypothetical protein
MRLSHLAALLWSGIQCSRRGIIIAAALLFGLLVLSLTLSIGLTINRRRTGKPEVPSAIARINKASGLLEADCRELTIVGCNAYDLVELVLHASQSRRESAKQQIFEGLQRAESLGINTVRLWVVSSRPGDPSLISPGVCVSAP